MRTHLMIALSLPILVWAAPRLRAAEPPGSRSITVMGEAEVKVVPDEVVVTFGLETKHRDLMEIPALHEQRMKALLQALTSAGIPSHEIRTDYLTLEPVHEYVSSRQQQVGYAQRTIAVVSLRELPKFQVLLTTAFKAGVEHLHGVEFRTSSLRTHRDTARALALKAAREKAAAMARELDQRIGKPRTIVEGEGGFRSSYGGWWGRGHQGNAQNITLAAPGGSELAGALAPGTLSVRAHVTVTFDLE